MAETMLYLVLYAGVLAGAVVAGLAGFAFSAVAGAILLHVLPSSEAVPLMMACSIVIQGASVLTLRRAMRWESLPYIVGGIVGIPPALYLLYHVDTKTFRVGFGIFLRPTRSTCSFARRSPICGWPAIPSSTLWSDSSADWSAVSPPCPAR